MLAGFAWALALGIQPRSGLLYGVIIGAITGLLLHIVSKAVSMRGNITEGEASFMTTMQSTFLLILAISTTLVSWGIRLIFL